jgi:hypothetical protein
MKMERVSISRYLGSFLRSQDRNKVVRTRAGGIRTFILIYGEALLSDHIYEAGK